MRKPTWAAISLVTAAALFAVGALGPLRPGRSASTPAVSPIAALGVPLPGADLDQRIAALKEKLNAGEGDERDWAQLGFAYQQKTVATADPSYYVKSARALRKSLDIKRTYDGLLGMGILAAARHQFAAGLVWGRRAARFNPAGPDAQGVIGDSLLELGRYAGAKGAFQRMVDLRPNVASYSRVSYYRELHGDVAGALDAFKTGLDFAGTPTDAAWVSSQIGDLYMGAGKVTAARRFYARGDSLLPDFPAALAGLAKTAAARGRFGRAESILSTVVEISPTSEHVTLLGDVLTRLGRPEDAREQYARAHAIDMREAKFGVNIYVEMGLGDADHGPPGRALAEARRGYRLRPSIQGADSLAWALYANGRYSAAARHSSEALRLGTENATFYYHAGMIASKLDRRARARSLLTKSLRTNPNFSFVHAPKAERVLRRLGGSTGVG